MTDKKERIMSTALKLFAQKGFASTSTRKVAEEAGVSEGLIFRHFKNKEGLLQAILDMAKEAAQQSMADVVLANDPKEVILNMIELPYKINPETYEMWRLTYALKWQMDHYDASNYAAVRLVLNNAFKTLGYKDPEAETNLLFMFIDGAATALLLHEPEHKSDVMECLKRKYEL